MTIPRLRLALSLAATLTSTASVGCSKSPPTPEKEPLPSASPVVSAAPSGSGALAPAPARVGLPTLAPEPIAATKGMSVDFYGIEGALVVVSGVKVGRLVDDKIEWFGTLPETNAWLGGSQINGVLGSWPDAVDVLYSSNNGRASQPSIYPLTGKGASVTYAEGGGLGWVSGTARLGKTTVVGGYDMYNGYTIKTFRGPGLVIKPTRANKVDCKEEELQRQWGDPEEKVAVSFNALAATEKGTLVTVGNLCERSERPVAEVWDEPGKSRIIELNTWIKKLDYFPQLLVGKGDDLWLASTPVLHYSGGKFEPLPSLAKPFKSFFVSASGVLHGIAGKTIYKLADGQWVAHANLPWPMQFSTIVMDDKGVIWVAWNYGVAQLKEQSADIEGECKTPFVYLYDVSWKNEPTYTYPTTRKALATFPEVSDISLVEYWEGRRSLGVQVKSKQQAEAVAAHIVANMKDEHPEVVCYAPKKPRVIDMKAAK